MARSTTLRRLPVSTGVGQRRLLELQGGFHRFRRWCGVESGQHIEDVFGAERAGLDDQFHRDKNGLQPRCGHGGEHLGHDPVSARVAQQALSQSLQRRWQVGKGRAVAQRTGLALHQVNVVLDQS